MSIQQDKIAIAVIFVPARSPAPSRSLWRRYIKRPVCA